MTPENYTKLCEVCDEILLRDDSGIVRVAVNWLHIIRGHPDFTKEYEIIYSPLSKAALLMYRYKLYFYHQFLYFLRITKSFNFRSIYKNKIESELNGKSFEEVDILFVSHLVSINQFDTNIDFYFGDIPHYLLENGKKTAIALINHTSLSEKQLKPYIKNTQVPIFVLPNNLGFSLEKNIHKSLQKESRVLKRISSEYKGQVHKKICLIASIQSLSGMAHNTLRIYFNLKKLVEQLKPKCIITTYEGHAWERLAFSAARSYNENIKCIGYLHSVLFYRQHSIKRELSQNYNPDLLLTSGEVAKSQLKKSDDSVPVEVLGTRRVNNYFDYLEELPQVSNKTCLILPDGFLEECHLLFQFSLKCAILSPQIIFRWRLHPILTFENILKKYPEFLHLPENIILSSNSLEQDLALSRWAVYRGSTTAISAVNAGLRPLYLALENEVTIDPLYELKKWRLIVTDELSFAQIASADSKKELNELTNEYLAALEYCKKVYTKIDYNLFTELSI
jgi:hypothetical protein